MAYSSLSSWFLHILFVVSASSLEQRQEGLVGGEDLGVSGGANNPNDPGLSRYVSRPDLAAPIWDVKIYKPEQVADGYWFVSPYKALDADQTTRSWMGPHIYNGKTGELVWSGSMSYFFNEGNIEDFRLSNVRGEEKMTFMSAGKGQAVVMGNDYQIEHTLQVDKPQTVNTHELHFVENGTRALVIKSHQETASKNMSRVIGYDGKCVGQFDGFEEYDTKTWNSTFDWRSYGKVGFEESTLTGAPVYRRCNNWDFIHSNSVDKTPEGDYLWSSRHTDTVFKISGKDGHIIWRLGGKYSDFKHIGNDMVFSRQHNIRQRSKNSTHTIITILDNAKGVDKQAPTWDYSRGMRIALDEKNMTATVEQVYNHPDGVGGYAPRRGNYQILENGNIFMGWSEQAKQSEHDPDGSLVMEAVLKTDWLGTYRSYKFPFLGNPIEPPVAHAQAYSTPNNATVTTVHASWNGATNVTRWNLYRTVANGQINILVATAERLGFETVLSYGGYASYVIVEAVNQNGTVLGRTSVMKTYAHPNITAEAVAEDDHWLNDIQDSKDDLVRHAKGILANPITTFIFGCILTAFVMWVYSHVRHRNLVSRYFGWIEGPRYSRVPDSGDDAGLPLSSLAKNTRHEAND